MPLQIDGSTVGEVRYARNDGTLATVGEARVWDDGRWKTVYESWRPRIIIFHLNEFSRIDRTEGDETMLSYQASNNNREFGVPVTASHDYANGDDVYRAGAIIPAGTRLLTTSGFAPNISVTFTEVRT